MPTVMIPREIHEQEAAVALSRQLGNEYTVTPLQRGNREGVRVQRGAMSTATVHLHPMGSETKLKVHGGGIIIGRLVNEMAIARTVASAAREAFGTSEEGPTC